MELRADLSQSELCQWEPLPSAMFAGHLSDHFQTDCQRISVGTTTKCVATIEVQHVIWEVCTLSLCLAMQIVYLIMSLEKSKGY